MNILITPLVRINFLLVFYAKFYGRNFTGVLGLYYSIGRPDPATKLLSDYFKGMAAGRPLRATW